MSANDSTRFLQAAKVGLTWLWFATPIAILVAVQVGPRPSELEWRQRLAISLPDDEAVRLALIGSMEQRGRHLDAIAQAQDFTLEHPESDAVFRKLLILNSALGRREAALASFERIAALNKETADDYVAAGILEFESAPERARTLFEAALELEAAHVAANVNLAVVLADEGDLDGARAHLLRAQREDPTNLDVLVNLARVELRAGRSIAARESLERALVIDPGNVQAGLLLEQLSRPVTGRNL